MYLDADERTNRILMIGHTEQLAIVESVIEALDVAQHDPRTLRIYNIVHIAADDVEQELQDLAVIGKSGKESSAVPPVFASKASSAGSGGATSAAEEIVAEDTQVTVLEATNSLLIQALLNAESTVSASSTITGGDVEEGSTMQEPIPYEIHFLENQDPEALAEVIGRLIQETVTSKDDKTQKPQPRRAGEEITIVPDKGTFSLIVYANKKNQDWISKLIKALDRRRPQVLIDVTLVEIRKTDEFNYDLNAITSFPDLTQTSGQTGTFRVDPGWQHDHPRWDAEAQSDQGWQQGTHAGRHPHHRRRV